MHLVLLVVDLIEATSLKKSLRLHRFKSDWDLIDGNVLKVNKYASFDGVRFFI